MGLPVGFFRCGDRSSWCRYGCASASWPTGSPGPPASDPEAPQGYRAHRTRADPGAKLCTEAVGFKRALGSPLREAPPAKSQAHPGSEG